MSIIRAKNGRQCLIQSKIKPKHTNKNQRKVISYNALCNATLTSINHLLLILLLNFLVLPLYQKEIGIQAVWLEKTAFLFLSFPF